MKRKLKKLARDLSNENKEVFNKINYRLEGSVIHKSVYKENLYEILNMLIEGQKRNESYKEVIGENLDGFCEGIIENSYKPNGLDKIFRITYLFSIGISIQLFLNILLYFLFYKENIILKAILGQLPKVDIIHYIIWATTAVIYFLSQELVVRTSLKKTSTHSLAIGVLLIAVYLQKATDKINFVYMVDVNYILLTLLIVSIIISYKIYNLKIIEKFKINLI